MFRIRDLKAPVFSESGNEYAVKMFWRIQKKAVVGFGHPASCFAAFNLKAWDQKSLHNR